MKDYDVEIREAFQEVSGVVRDCVLATGNAIRASRSKLRQEYPPELFAQSIASGFMQIEMTTAKAQFFLPAVERHLSSLYHEPPEPVGGCLGPCHHAIAVRLGWKTLFGMYLAAGLDPLELSDPLPVRGIDEVRSTAATVGRRATQVDAYLRDGAPDFDTDWLVSMLEIEASRGTKSEVLHVEDVLLKLAALPGLHKGKADDQAEKPEVPRGKKRSFGAIETDKLILQALVKHHEHRHGRSHCFDPIKFQAIVKKGPSKATVSRWFRECFTSYQNYKAECNSRRVEDTIEDLMRDLTARESEEDFGNEE